MAGEKKTLKNWQISNLHRAISALGGRVEYPKNVDGKAVGDKPIVVPYKFGGKAAYAIGKTDAALSRVIAGLESQQKTAVRLAYPEGAPKDTNGNDDTTLCNETLDQIANDESEVEIYMVSVDELNINENGIAPAIIGMLEPMIRD